MIGIDTNILVRYLAQDDPVESLKATKLIERQLTEENPGFLSVLAIAGTAWVVGRAYRLADHEIAAAIERRLHADLRPQGAAASRLRVSIIGVGAGRFLVRRVL
ncbi:MAG: hypothetical protein ACLQU2_13185 [Candidatus Binataceae bacterium]